jgi:hypothetical protein
MTWLMLILLAAGEASIALLLLQWIIRWRWTWLRWVAWLAAAIVSSGAGLIVYPLVLSKFRPNDLWLTRQELLSLQAPYPTYRAYLFVVCASFAFFWIVLGLSSGLRRGDAGLKLIRREVSFWRSMQMALGVGICLVLVAVINDRLICWRIRQLRDRGRELASSLTPPPCPPDQNAAAVYLTLGGQIDGAQQKLRLVDGNLLSLQSDECTKFFAENEEVAVKLRRAAALPHCRFDADFTNASILQEHPEFQQLNACIHFLFLQGHRALFDGDADQGIANIVALRQIARQLTEDPRESAFYAAISACNKTASLLEHLCYVRQPTEGEVARISANSDDLWNRLEKLFSWLEAKAYFGVADDYFGLAIDEKEKKFPGLPLALPIELARMRMIYAPDDLRALPPIYPKIREFVRLSYDELLGGAAKEREPLWRQVKRAGGGHLMNNWLDNDMIFFRSAQVVDMRQRLADFGLTMVQRNLAPAIRDRGASDVIPASERPIDLFDGQPLRIITADGGVVIYSVDVYGGDDGGTEGIPASVAGRYLRDMTFCIGEAYRVRRLKSPEDELSAESN